MKRLILVGPLANARALKNTKFGLKDTVIGIDGGAGVLARAGQSAHAAIGDWDSIRGKPKAELIVTLPRAKDYSDFAFALYASAEWKPEEILLLGLDGGRIDHEFGVYLEIVEFLKTHQVPLVRWIREDGDFIFMSGPARVSISKTQGKVLSLFSLLPPAVGIRLAGVHYQPASGRLKRPSHGFSNAVRTRASVRLHKGLLLVIIPTRERG
ncbi:MAG: hypothetical protein ACXWPM_00565 [Bdellovibrionota bacterium]